MQCDADPDAVDYNKQTALMVAVFSGELLDLNHLAAAYSTCSYGIPEWPPLPEARPCDCSPPAEAGQCMLHQGLLALSPRHALSWHLEPAAAVHQEMQHAASRCSSPPDASRSMLQTVRKQQRR